MKYGRWENRVTVCLTNQTFWNMPLQTIHKLKIRTKLDSNIPMTPSKEVILKVTANWSQDTYFAGSKHNITESLVLISWLKTSANYPQ